MSVLGQQHEKQQGTRQLRWVLVGLVTLASWEVGELVASFLTLNVFGLHYPLTLVAGDLPLDHLAVFLARTVLALGIAALLALPSAALLMRR